MKAEKKLYRKVGEWYFEMGKEATKIYGTPPKKEPTLFTEGAKAKKQKVPAGWYILQYLLNSTPYYLRKVEEIRPKLYPKKVVKSCNPTADLKKAKLFKSKAAAKKYLKFVNDFCDIKTPMARVLYFGPKKPKKV